MSRNKQIVIVLLILLSVFVSNTEAYNFNRPNSYFFNTSIDDVNSTYSFQSVLDSFYFNSRFGNSYINVFDDGSYSSINVKSNIGTITSQYYTSTEEIWMDYYNSDTGTESYLQLNEDGLTISDNLRSDGYACWVGGQLISQSNACGT